MRLRFLKGFAASVCISALAVTIFHGCGGGGSGSRDATASLEDRSTIFANGDINQGSCGDATACTKSLLSACLGVDSSELTEVFAWVSAKTHLDAARTICRAADLVGLRGGLRPKADPVAF